nr:hypothetical protein Iba_chr12dCG20370 [Ipomoea batatas]
MKSRYGSSDSFTTATEPRKRGPILPSSSSLGLREKCDEVEELLDLARFVHSKLDSSVGAIFLMLVCHLLLPRRCPGFVEFDSQFLVRSGVVVVSNTTSFLSASSSVEDDEAV